MSILWLALLLANWLIGWRVAARWCYRLGVREHCDCAVLGGVIPCAALVTAVHIPALVALITGYPVVTLETVAIANVAILFAASRALGAPRAQVTWSLADGRSSIVAMIRCPKGVRWSVLIVGATYGFFLLEALTRFPTGYDGLYYHLPTAALWMRTGKLDLVLGDIYHSLPENGMIVPFLLSFAGLERVISLFNIPNGLILMASIYALSRAVGAKRRGAIAAACIAGSVPIVLFQTFSSYIDLYGAAAWISSLLALLWVRRAKDSRARHGLLVVAGLSAGIALGSKSTYLVHVGFLVLIAAWAAAWETSRIGSDERAPVGAEQAAPSRLRMGCALRGAALFAAVAGACSAFWFVRGAVQAGNPLYPFQVEIAGHEIFPGFEADDHVPSRSWSRKWRQWSTYLWRETNYAGTGYDYGVNNGVGAAFATFVPIAILLTLQGLRPTPERGTRGAQRMLCLLALAGPLLLMTVFTEVLRYALPLMLAAIPLTGLLVDRIRRWSPRAAETAISLALAITCTIALLPPAKSLAGRGLAGEWSREWCYQVPAVINELPPGSRILYIGPADLTYAFMGRGFRHEVIHEYVWRARYPDRPMNADLLHEAGVNFVLLREPWPVDWSSDVLKTPVFDDRTTRPLSTTAVTTIYAVGADRQLAGQGSRESK